jgi:hypothetical protein
MSAVGNCNAHPHDGLRLDAAGDAWVSEQFGNAIAEIIPPSAGSVVGAAGSSLSSNAATPVDLVPANVVAPTIHGRLREGHVLIARKGTWVNDPAKFAYRWQRCTPACANVAGGTGVSYRLSARDVDASVRVVVTAANAAGTARAKSRATGPIGPSLKRVKAAVAKLLATSAKRSAIARLLGNGSWRGAFGAPSSGRLSVVISGGRRHALVATARWRFSKAGSRMITVRLTRNGGRLLKRGKVTLGVLVVFVPAGGRPVRSFKRLTLAGEPGR